MSLRPDCKADVRKQRYKVAVDIVEARRKREENMVEIRKSKREESLRKKRGGVASARDSEPSSGYDQKISLDEKTLSETVSALSSYDVQAKEAAVINLRNILSIEGSLPIDAVIQSGVVPLLVDILRRGDMPRLQFEAAWALANILSGTSEHTKVVVDCGALPIFVELLTSIDNVREQAIRALGNIAGDSTYYRDLALGHGALRPVLAQFNETAKISTIRSATWTLLNFCRGKPQPQLDQVKYALPALRWLIHMQDDEVLADACWALSYLSDGPIFKNHEIIDAGICPKLAELLSHPSPVVIIPALRTVGNIVSGDDVETQSVIDNQVLPRILHLLTSYKTNKSILRDACWTISNITAGTREQIQAVIDAKIFTPLFSLLETAEFDIKREAAWAVLNATSGGSNEQIQYLAFEGCIRSLCQLLTCHDPGTIVVCLEGLDNILRAGDNDRNVGLTDFNVYAQLIQGFYGLEKIENLQFHKSTEINEKSVNILQKYFENYFSEEDHDHMVTSDIPQTAPGFSTDQESQVPPGGFNF